MESREALEQAAQLDRLGTVLGGLSELENPLAKRDGAMLTLARVLATPSLQPVLVGEVGVGKHSLVNLLARACRSNLEGKDHLPRELQDRRIVMVRATDFAAGALYVNHLEHKCRLVVENAEKNRTILFLPELGALVGSGSSTTDPESDIASILLPFLREGRLRAIGATTPEGWMQVCQRTPSFARVFTPLTLPEPGIDETLSMLRARAARWRRVFGVTVSPAALREAVELADRLYPARRLPGKACELLEAALALDASGGAGAPPAGLVLSTVAPAPAAPAAPVARLPELGPSAIADAVRKLTRLPEFIVVPSKPAAAATLRAFFDQRVLGQDHVVTALVDRIMMVQSRLCAPGRPLATFLLTGPTGVGKTFVARALAELLLGDPRRLIRYDMSEYCTVETAGRFVGENRIHRRAPGLVDAVLAQPFPVLLLDEIEKAHRSIFDLLLQVMGEGRLTDEVGRTADFGNAIILMTSNLGVDRGRIDHPRDPAASMPDQQRLRDALMASFRPEFVNRLTGVFAFRPLEHAQVAAIARREIAALERRSGLRARGLKVEVTPAMFAAVVAEGYSREFGARPMERAVDRLVGAAIAQFLAQNPTAAKGVLCVDVPGAATAAQPRCSQGGA